MVQPHNATHRKRAKTTPEYKRFTVAQLRETLADMPDSAEVFIGAEGYECDKAGLYVTIGQITLPIIEV